MHTIQETIELLHSPGIYDLFSKLYGKEAEKVGKQIVRYEQLVHNYHEHFPDGELRMFSTPGRTEIGGNHTDHNHGRVLAASIDLDSIGAIAGINDPWVTIYSEGYPNPFRVCLDDLSPQKEEQGTTSALIRGIAARLTELGYTIGGFNGTITSDVLVGSGLSSSASIEVLIGTIFNVLYNEGHITPEVIAKIGQYAENTYFGKPCGLMDQLTCAVGGIVSIDFEDPQKPVLQKVDFDFATQDFKLLVVDTGGNHADLTEDYASVPREMKSVARALGGNVLREIEFHTMIDRIHELRSRAGDRAVLRAMHFFDDNQRVLDQVEALKRGDFDRFLVLVNASGNSSFKWLQNCYSTKNPAGQGVSLALALTEDYLQRIGRGGCRVHGGGFAGTIQVFLHDDHLNEYVRLMDGVFGEGSVRVLTVRPVGSICINSFV